MPDDEGAPEANGGEGSHGHGAPEHGGPEGKFKDCRDIERCACHSAEEAAGRQEDPERENLDEGPDRKIVLGISRRAGAPALKKIALNEKNHKVMIAKSGARALTPYRAWLDRRLEARPPGWDGFCIPPLVAINVVRLGTPRQSGEGLRIGTVRRPPRGVKKKDYAARDFFDVWLPELAPSAALVASALSEVITTQRWSTFARRYRREMREPAARRLILMLAALSAQTNFSVGCYCADESHCHRSLLRQILIEEGATMTGTP